ncbi:clr-2 [Rasamsonia emersonii CBS 393.64]|uniref:Clr-2 n=1 Tax=Rasamsonia emersonii (strain ATCC 16479 / CBS 393.64 / IMI 116815) TaxID=1408163 RepID=A0A0F4YQ52_RASE3|nr:clr-2 [Rasamsonia emersonii CBS 393.64]KKA20215.1 clr-2 [Rasamsonia emersonii CBS 393.64]
MRDAMVENSSPDGAAKARVLPKIKQASSRAVFLRPADKETEPDAQVVRCAASAARPRHQHPRSSLPCTDLDSLAPLTRDALIDLLQSSRWQTSPFPPGSQSNPSPQQSAQASNPSDLPDFSNDGRSGTFEYDEPVNSLAGTEAVAVADDVNSLSLRRDRGSSYLGASSAAAGLRVLLKIAPDTIFSRQESIKGGAGVPSLTQPSRSSNVPLRVARDHRELIDNYFTHVHPVTPILDEAEFRATFESGKSQDPAWFALLNMVFALGTIAATTSDSDDDIYYYNVAKSYIGFDSFGSGHLETLQALILIAGWYLHYRNRPNMASAILGAVFRMAYALGLHRELPGGEGTPNAKQRELRRRIWWSLVVLDTNETTTFGRISNRPIFDFAVNLPRNIDDKTGEVVSGPTVYSMLIADIEFSRLASRIQERLVSSPLLSFSEMLTLDAHLVCWHESLPSFLRAPESLPHVAHAVLRRVAFQDLDADQKVCVRKCQSLARNAIECIGSEWSENQFSGWPAVWYLFQASIIPLLCLYSFKDESHHVDDWNQQVQKSIDLLRKMEPWSVAAKRSCELISMLYDTYKETLKTDVLPSETARPTPPDHFFAADVAPPLPTGPPDSTSLSLWDGLFDSAEPDFPDLGFGMDRLDFLG